MMELSFIPVKSYMLEALELARHAGRFGDVPIGAVVELEGKVIGRGRNCSDTGKTPLGHAELMAIDEAARVLGSRRLTGCNIYITVEPCPMCTGAILNSGISNIIYGADEERTGCVGSAIDLRELVYYKTPGVYRGFMAEEAKKLMQDFFLDKR